jgi:hypothetical protein
MVPTLALLSRQTSIRLAEIASLLVLIAGIWFVAAEIPSLRMSKTRGIIAGVLLAVAGLLLIIAIHWGQFS